MKLEIFVSDNSRIYKNKNGEIILSDSTFLNDIYVKINNCYYNIYVHDFVNFVFDHKNEIKEAINFLEPIDSKKVFKCNNQIGLPANFVLATGGMSKHAVINALLAQDYHFFYERLKPCEVINDEIQLDLSPSLKAEYIEEGDPLSIPINKLIKLYPNEDK